MKDRFKLPFHFDPERLQSDMSILDNQRSDWTDHFVKRNYEGSWSVIPLRGPKGADHPVMMIYSDPACNEFEDTVFLRQCPYFREVLDHFKCDIQAVRLMKLASGSEIKEHVDYDLDFEGGTIRLHVPVHTNPDVEFYLNNKRVQMLEGECWWLKLSEPHRVVNNGDDRIHLVIDMKVNEWITSIVMG